MNTNRTNSLKLLAIPQLMGKHFFIPDYQRGYRWGKDQVYTLLKDLWKYFKSGKNEFYCLQPIVVKQCSEEVIKKYELPDISNLQDRISRATTKSELSDKGISNIVQQSHDDYDSD